VTKVYRLNPGHLPTLEGLVDDDATYESFEDYYPASASGELGVEAEDREPENIYYGRNVAWIGTEGRMLRVDPEYALHISGNIFYPDKLSAVVKGVVEHPERVYFVAPYGTISKVDLYRVKESIEYAETGDDEMDMPYSTGDDELDEYLVAPETVLEDYGEPGDEEYEEKKEEMEESLRDAVENNEGDLGSWAVTIRDGNHRTFGSLLAGEPYVWAILDDNTYQDLLQMKKEGNLSDKDRELLDMLH